MSWFYLFVAGLFEAFWLISLNKSDSFSNKTYAFIAVASMAVSLYLFSLSTKQLPVSSAYLIWLSVGVFSVAIIEHFWIGKELTTNQIFFLLVILSGVFGLKLSS